MTRRLVPEALKRRVKRRLGCPDHEATLARMKAVGFSPRVVIDVGAHHGAWTRLCKRMFPECRVLMVEPQKDSLGRLQALASECADVEIASCLLGAAAAPAVDFLGTGTNASVLREHAKPPRAVASLPMRTLAEVVAGSEFARPDLVKLDVQGYELEVLKGAGDVIACAEALVLEVSLIPIYDDCPLLDEVLGFMGERGFAAYDVCGLIRRPRDRALWQMDVMFVRDGSRLSESRSWD